MECYAKRKLQRIVPSRTRLATTFKMKQFVKNALVIAVLVIVIYLLSSTGARWP